MSRPPNFIIAGAQKSGTSALHSYLSRHPDIFMSTPKELHFFDQDPDRRDLGRYLSHFESQRAAVLGESTPFYMNYPGAAGSIAEICPQVRIIMVLRDPVDRAYSHYWHEVKKGWEQLPFEAAIAEESRRLARSLEWWRHYSYLVRGRYWVFVRDFLDLLGPDRVKVVFFEDVARDPRAQLEDVCRFLGVDPALLPEFEARRINASRLPRWRSVSRLTGLLAQKLGDHNFGSRLLRRLNLQTAQYPPMGSQLRARLVQSYAEDNARLVAVCGLTPPWGTAPRVEDNNVEMPDWGVLTEYWLPRASQSS